MLARAKSAPGKAAGILSRCVIVLLPCIGHVFAQVAVGPRNFGEIVFLRGAVDWATLESGWTEASVGQPIRQGDGIKTKNLGIAGLYFPDDRYVRVAPDTVFRIRARMGATTGFVATLEEGKILYLNRRDVKPGEAEFIAGTVKASTAGTEAIIHVDPRGVTTFIVLDGALVIPPSGKVAESTIVGPFEQAEVGKDGTISKRKFIRATAPMQWLIYYPLILDPAAAEVSAASPWRNAWLAYQRGAIATAVTEIPAVAPAADAERLLATALALACGRADLAEIKGLETETAQALRVFVAVAKDGGDAGSAQSFRPESATGWLAMSYARQSAGELPDALAAAKKARDAAPGSAYSLLRVGELAFALGFRREADQAVRQAVKGAPDLATGRTLEGFLLAAAGERDKAAKAFSEAVKLDPELGPARLGTGILAHGNGAVVAGRHELLRAAALNPLESLPRSYLAKAWLSAGDIVRATAELEIARKLDPDDPTPALYAALAAQRDNRPNDAIRDLERSVTLNRNRRLFRSRQLLDSDFAVRRTNLAMIFDAAGAETFALREAGTAVRDDPTNFSAHLFLARAYDLLRDPVRINLRYETPWSGSLILARLLAPAGSGALAPSVGLGEYSALFEPARFDVHGELVYQTNKEWRNTLVHSGSFGRTNYSLELDLYHFDGWLENQDFDRRDLTLLATHQVTPDDTISLQAFLQKARGGDLRAGLPENLRSVGLRSRDGGKPIASLGYRHHWKPLAETLAFFARLETESELSDSQAWQVILVQEPDGTLTPLRSAPVSSLFKNRLRLYQAEIAHLQGGEKVSGQFGLRFQRGYFEGRNRLTPAPGSPIGLFPRPTPDLFVHEPFHRLSLYGYGTWKLGAGWSVLGGVGVDAMRFPDNLYTEPITAGTSRQTTVSPRVGIVWQHKDRVTLRAAHAESRGGVSFEESFRLEPVQFAGFTQGVRSLIPESVGGSTVAPRLRIDGLGITTRWAAPVYLDLEAQIRYCDAARKPGAFVLPPLPIQARALAENLALRERQVTLNAFWILSSRWSLAGGFEWADTELSQVFANAPALTLALRSRLLVPKVKITWNSPKGYFARTETKYFAQRGGGGDSISTTRSAWDTGFLTGYRARSAKWEIALGVNNLWARSFDFDALTLPRLSSLDRSAFFRLAWTY